MLKRFPLQIGKVEKRVKMLMFFWGRRPLKSEFEGSKPRKDTCTKQNMSFELLNVRIGLELQPVGEMIEDTEKYEKGENLSHKTVIFHHCVEVPPVNRSQPNLACL